MQVVALGTVALTEVALLVATQLGNRLNTVLNAITIVLLLGAAIPVIRSRRKDKAIEDLEKLNAAQAAYIIQIERERDGAIKRADRAEEKAGRSKEKADYLEGKLHKAEEYSAPQAFDRMAKHLETLEHTMAEALRSTSELALRNTAILAAIAERLSVQLPDEIPSPPATHHS